MNIFPPDDDPHPDPARSIIEAAAELLTLCESPGSLAAAHEAITAALQDVEHPLGPRLDAVARALQAPPSDPGGSSFGSASVAPTGGNIIRPSPRYFRLLVWNLENFTRDPRPRGSAPIDSIRNQARAAIVAHLMARLCTDVLLVMETGSDVGPAMTAIAERARALFQPFDDRPCEPLVSPATHAIPEVPVELLDHAPGRPTMRRALALRLLAERFELRPADARLQAFIVTANQLRTAWELLPQCSSAAAAFLGQLPDPFPAPTPIPNRASVGPALSLLMPAVDEVGKRDRDDTRLVFDITHDLVNSLGRYPLDEQLGALSEAVLACRAVTRALAGATDDERRRLRGALEVLELGMLFAVAADVGVGSDGFLGRLFSSRHAPGGSVPLSVFLLAGAQHLDIRALDPDLGPLADADDREIMLEALRTINAVAYASETYGMVYRPRTAVHLRAFLNGPTRQHGYDADGIYGILQTTTSGQALRAQDPMDLLRGRSALEVHFPLEDGLWLPLALHHNRFTGSAAIRQMEDRFTNDENVVRARCLTLCDVAASHRGDPPLSQPLVVGDFNIPRLYLEPEPEPQAERSRGPWARREYIRRELASGMARAGYLRRSRGGAHPSTTLAANATLAEGTGTLSEAYDGVYQPFDFLGGAVTIRSAAVTAVELIFTDALRQLAVRGARPAREPEEVDLESAPDDEDDGSMAMDLVDDEDPRDDPEAPVEMSVLDVLASELERVHRAFGRPVLRVLDELHAWTGRRTRRHTQEAVDAIIRLTARRAHLEQTLTGRAAAFRDAFLRDPDAPLDDADPFADLRADVNRAARIAGTPSLSRLTEAMDRATERIRGIEAHPARRWYVAYRVVVSDHLPLLIEIDLQPGR